MAGRLLTLPSALYTASASAGASGEMSVTSAGSSNWTHCAPLSTSSDSSSE